MFVAWHWRNLHTETLGAIRLLPLATVDGTIRCGERNVVHCGTRRNMRINSFYQGICTEYGVFAARPLPRVRGDMAGSPQRLFGLCCRMFPNGSFNPYRAHYGDLRGEINLILGPTCTCTFGLVSRFCQCHSPFRFARVCIGPISRRVPPTFPLVDNRFLLQNQKLLANPFRFH